ncbi:hypothetical protein Tco_0719878 [Tanacetum coccineum]
MDIVVVGVVGVVVVVIETLVLFDDVMMDSFEVVVVDEAGTLVGYEHGSDVIDPFEHVREIFIPTVFIVGYRNRNTLVLVPTNTEQEGSILFGLPGSRQQKFLVLRFFDVKEQQGIDRVHDEKCVWFELELQGAQRDRKAKVFQVINDDTSVAQRRLKDKKPEEKKNTDCFIKEQEQEYQTGWKIKTEDTTRSTYPVNRSPSSVIGFKKPIDMLRYDTNATRLQGHSLSYNTSSLDDRKYSSLALENQSLDHLETRLYDLMIKGKKGNQNRRDLPRDTLLDRVEVLRSDDLKAEREKTKKKLRRLTPKQIKVQEEELVEIEAQRKAQEEELVEIEAHKDIVVYGMQRNLTVPEEVFGSAGILHLATTAQRIRIQNVIKIDSVITREMYDEMIYVIEIYSSAGMDVNWYVYEIRLRFEDSQRWQYPDDLVTL